MEADLLLKRATVVDGTGRKGFTADVAVRGERIIAAGDLAAAAAGREIDCRGLVLSPGFVDIHGHSDFFIMILPSAEGKVKQGVTTEAGGNCGYSGAPLKGRLKDDRAESHMEMYGLRVDWEDFPDFLDRIEAARPAMNYAPLVGFNTVRASAGCYTREEPDQGTLGLMKAMIREALEAGAFGMSMGLIYPPGAFASVQEIAQCAAVCAERGAMVSSHMRSEGDRLVQAVEEAVEIARLSGARFQVSHIKTSGQKNWGKLERVFEIIEGAQKNGLDIRADRYPYLASFTQLSAALPEWVHEGGKDAFLQRLNDKAVRERIKKDLSHSDELDDRWDRIMVAQVFKQGLEKHQSKTVAECAEAEGEHPVDFVCRLVEEAKDRVSAVYHTMSAGNLERIIKKDWVMAGSDAAVRTHRGFLSEGKPHPRAYGAMPRMISWVVREKGWLDLPAAVKKMTRDPCDMLGIHDRGVIKEGAYGDLVLFDPERIRDTATYQDPQQYPEGIEMVVVNGKVTVEKGELTGERAGRVLRRS